jgi:hypothetical protein
MHSKVVRNCIIVKTMLVIVDITMLVKTVLSGYDANHLNNFGANTSK